jgi:hypothetical protein
MTNCYIFDSYKFSWELVLSVIRALMSAFVTASACAEFLTDEPSLAMTLRTGQLRLQ